MTADAVAAAIAILRDQPAITFQLTIEATDPKSGTAEFKATAVRIDKLEAPVEA